MKQSIDPGVHLDMPDSVYQSLPYLRASDMPAAARSMAHLREYRECDRGDSDALLFGRLFHAVMDGTADDRFIASDGPINKRTGAPYGRDKKAYSAWLAAQDQSREIVPTAWVARAKLMAGSVGWSSAARVYTANMQREVTFIARIEGVMCKARVDLFDASRGLWADYKTTSASAEAFPSEARRRQYPLKAAFQRAVIEAAIRGSCHQYAWIVVETEPPHGCIVWTMQLEALAAYAGRVGEIIRDYGEAIATDYWPNYTNILREMPLKPWDIPTTDEVLL